MTPSDLEAFLTTGVFAFMIVFVRIGTIVMIMPGIGNAFVPANVRLYFALGFTLVLTPLFQDKIPYPLPPTGPLMTIILTEFIIGLFIGTIMRIFMAAIDTAGMLIATQSSLANAQLFNPTFASQGTVIGSFLTLTAVVLLFATNMHHMMIAGMVNSYDVFPLGDVPPVENLFTLVREAVAMSFAVAIQMSAPFLIVVFVLYVGMGVLSKIMPQVQIFMLAVPVQVVLGFLLLSMSISAMMLYWLASYDNGISFLIPKP